MDTLNVIGIAIEIGTGETTADKSPSNEVIQRGWIVAGTMAAITDLSTPRIPATIATETAAIALNTAAEKLIAKHIVPHSGEAMKSVIASSLAADGDSDRPLARQ